MISLFFVLFTNLIAFMLTPGPILELFLFTTRASMRLRGTILILSRILTTFVFMMAVYYFGFSTFKFGKGMPKDYAFWLSTIIGIFFLIFAVFAWLTRPKDGETMKNQKWVSKIDKINPFLVLIFGVVTTLTGLKNLTLNVSAASHIAHYTNSPFFIITLTLIYCILGSLLSIIIWYLFIYGGERAKSKLAKIRDFVFKYGNIVTAILMIVLAIMEFYKAYLALG